MASGTSEIAVCQIDARHPQGMIGRETIGEDAAPRVDHAGNEDRNGDAAGEKREAAEAVTQTLGAANVDHAEDEGDRSDRVLQPYDVLAERRACAFAPAEVHREQAVLHGDELDQAQERNR